MGKQAARTGDTAMTCNDPSDMPVGTVVSTTTTVLIDKMPAAKQGDKIIGTDIHIIMIPSPGGPVPTPLPHPFVGTIDSGCSTSVNIMGMPAATVDSQASNMPPHIPQGGPFQKPPSNKAKIILGSFDVMIGGGGGGGGGGASGNEAKGTEVEAKKVEVAPAHKLDVKFEDKGGKPISGLAYEVTGPDKSKSEGQLAGEIKQPVAAEGSYEIKLKSIVKASWSKTQARGGDKVKINIETAGIEDDTDATVEVWERDLGRADKLIKTFDEQKVKSDKLEIEWECRYIDEDDIDSGDSDSEKYSFPSYFFKAFAGGCTAQSNILKFKDSIELTVQDENGDPAADEKYVLTLSNGEIREGKLDKDGYAKIDDVPPGPWKAEFPDLGEIFEDN